MNQQIAIGIALFAYFLVLAVWVWAGVGYMVSIPRLPATKDRCAAYSQILLSKIFLAAVATGPAGAIFGLLKK